MIKKNNKNEYETQHSYENTLKQKKKTNKKEK